MQPLRDSDSRRIRYWKSEYRGVGATQVPSRRLKRIDQRTMLKIRQVCRVCFREAAASPNRLPCRQLTRGLALMVDEATGTPRPWEVATIQSARHILIGRCCSSTATAMNWPLPHRCRSPVCKASAHSETSIVMAKLPQQLNRARSNISRSIVIATFVETISSGAKSIRFMSGEMSFVIIAGRIPFAEPVLELPVVERGASFSRAESERKTTLFGKFRKS
jgi:hypothetical protein